MGGESFQWETGNWGSMPLYIVEAFSEISIGMSEGMDYKRKQSHQESQANAGRNTNYQRRR